MANIQKLLNYFYLGKYNLAERMRDLLGFFYIRIYLIIILGVNLLNWLLVYIIDININQDLAILHYNVDFGVNLIGSVKQIYIIPCLGLIIALFNFILFFIIHYRNIQVFKKSVDKFFAHLLLGGAVLANLFLFFSLSSIYLINFLK